MPHIRPRPGLAGPPAVAAVSAAFSSDVDGCLAQISENEFAAEAALVDPPVRTREELAYSRIWRDHLAGVRPEQTLGRFATA